MRLQRKIDLLIFNPPYVPTIGEEVYGAQSMANIAGAWAGGTDGMQVTDVLLDDLDVCFFPVRVSVQVMTLGTEFAVSVRPVLPRSDQAERCTWDSESNATTVWIPK